MAFQAKGYNFEIWTALRLWSEKAGSRGHVWMFESRNDLWHRNDRCLSVYILFPAKLSKWWTEMNRYCIYPWLLILFVVGYDMYVTALHYFPYLVSSTGIRDELYKINMICPNNREELNCMTSWSAWQQGFRRIPGIEVDMFVYHFCEVYMCSWSN